MNMSSALLWAWVGVSVLSVAAAALVVVAEVQVEHLDALRRLESQRMCLAADDRRRKQLDSGALGGPMAGEHCVEQASR